MNRKCLFLSLVAIALLLFSSGCAGHKANADIEEVLQLNNDILEDPLLKELDSLEESLLVQDALPTTQDVAQASATPAASAPEPAPVSPEPAAVKPAAKPAVTAPAPASEPPPAAPAETVATADKRVLFGVIRKVSGSDITLQVIQAKTLTPEELKKIKNGEKIPLTLLTEEILQLPYGTKTDFERLENGSPVPATASDVVRGQRVRIALTPSGEVRLLRIIRN